MSLANSSSYLFTSLEISRMVPIFVTYLFEGLLILVTNLLTFVSIWRFELLSVRKDYVVVSALALVDALTGFGQCTAGLARLVMIARGSVNHLLTKWSCFLRPWNLAWFYADYTYGATLAIVSIDRLLSWVAPTRYWTWGRRYALGLIALSQLPYWPPMIYELASSVYPDKKRQYPQICYTEWLHSDKTYYILTTQRGVLAWLSVLVYFVVLYKYKQHTKRTQPIQGEESKETNVEKQKELTKTIGMSCLITLFTEILPRMCLPVARAVVGEQLSDDLIPIVTTIANLNKLANPLLYVKRHYDIRMAVICLCTGKHLTPTMIKPPRAGQQHKREEVIQMNDQAVSNVGSTLQ